MSERRTIEGGLAERAGDAVLVVAHPDDEILWFSSIFSSVSKVVICYLDVPGQPGWTEGRRAIAEDYPHGNVVFLRLVESVVIFGADWGRPVPVEEGLEVSRRPETLPDFNVGLYRSNYPRLKSLLERELDGFSTVVTHNPWGEYGNEEHVQVYRAVAALSRQMGFDVWYSNYCSDRSYRLMLDSVAGFRSGCETLTTSPESVRPLERLYRHHGCWTWPFDDYVHFSHESFFRDSRKVATDAGSTLPLNFIKVLDESDRAAPPGWRRHLRRIRRRARGLWLNGSDKENRRVA